MAIVNRKTMILPLFISLLFLAGVITQAGHPIYDSSYAGPVSIYARDVRHHNDSFETLDFLLAYADALNILRFSQNCSTGC